MKHFVSLNIDVDGAEFLAIRCKSRIHQFRFEILPTGSGAQKIEIGRAIFFGRTTVAEVAPMKKRGDQSPRCLVAAGVFPSKDGYPMALSLNM